MGKPTGKKKNQVGSKPSNSNLKRSTSTKGTEKSSKAIDEDTVVFITMSQELKEEGNKLFQKHDHEGAMLNYEKAIQLLPRNHIDVAYLRSNMAACYMQMGIGGYRRAISECNLALEVSPKYSKALLKRAKCYEALNRLDLAFRDVSNVLSIEPNNLTALEVEERLRKTINEKGLKVEGQEIGLPDDYVEPTFASKVVKGKTKRKKRNKLDKKKPEETKVEKKKIEATEEKKVVVEEKRSVKEEKVVTKMVKLVLGEDIRWAQVPVNCSVRLVRDIALDRYPSLKGALIKYKDQEGDLVTITTNDELRLAEALGDPQGFLRLYIAEISPDKEPVYEEDIHKTHNKPNTVVIDNGNAEKGEEEVEKRSTCVENWIVQFACIFKNHVGFECDSYLDLHEIGMKLYSEAMEDTVTSEDAQELFDIAAEKFQEMAALALFNWGNVHMSKARKRVYFPEDASGEALLAQVKTAYDWAQKEYVKAGEKYEEAVKVKPDFYEGLLAHGQQLFEQAKLYWYYAIGTKVDLDTESLTEVLELYNKAEDKMERGMEMWEEMEEQHLNGISKYEKYKAKLEKFGLDGLFNDDVSVDEAAVQVVNMKNQIYLLWGTLLYERSVVEFKLNLPTWEECVEVAVEKFELAGAPATDITVMIKNHCSSETALEGFKVDEIVQAWSEMYDTDKWQIGDPSSRLEPLFRRRVPKLHSLLEHL